MPGSYTAQLDLKIDGQLVSAQVMEDILQVCVEESLHLPGMFTLLLRNDYASARSNDNPWLHDQLFTMGKSVEISYRSSTTEAAEFDDPKGELLIRGEITAIEAHFNPEAQAPIVVRGYDISHRLHRGRFNRSFQNKTDSDIVKQIIKEAGIAAGTIDNTPGPFGFGDPVGYIFQENQTNMEFLRERAARHGYELFVQDGKLNFRKPQSRQSLELVWLQDISSFQVRVSSAEQVSAVEVRGWNYQTKQTIVSTRSSENSEVLTKTDQGKGQTASTQFKSAPKMIVVNQPVSSSMESDAIAQSLYNELSGEFVQADAKAEGNPEIRPGKVLKLRNLGKYSGSYYITETRHLYQQRVYTTEFSVRGLRDGQLLSIIAPPARLQPGQTLMIGVVTNNNDPKKWGRVRVKLPTLTEDHDSEWARVVAIGAGPNRGFDCLPEVNDEVLVGFEHGDIHRPFVIGGLWNGTDAPPTPVSDSVVNGKVRLRTVKTRTGHLLQFVEEDKAASKKGIYLKTVYGHQININDTDKKIEIKTNGGHHVTLDDQNKTIQVHSNGGHDLKLNDATRKITLQSLGTIEMTAPQEISLKVGATSLALTTAQATLKTATNTVELGPGGLNLSASAGRASLQGVSTNVQANSVVQVSAPMINLG
jgi:phage protein D